MRATKWLRVVAVTMVIVLFAAGCGDDDDGDDASDTTEQSDGSTTTEGSGGDDGGTVEVTLTDDGVEDMPEEVTAGIVKMKVTNDASLTASLDLIKAADDASEEEITEALQSAQEGGAIPEALDNFVGSPGVEPGESVEVSVTLTAGSWYAQALQQTEEGEEAEEESGEGSTDTTAGPSADSAPDSTEAEGGADESAGGEEPEPPVLMPFTVTEGESDDTALPDEGSTISAVDYSFELDIDPDADELSFSNDSSEQFHHAVFFAMAEGVDEAAGRAAVEQFLAATEDAGPPPPEFDFESDLGGDTNVAGPGLGVVQPQGNFESGRTYAVLCFIPDRAGGPPHAIGQNMWDVFTLG